MYLCILCHLCVKFSTCHFVASLSQLTSAVVIYLLKRLHFFSLSAFHLIRWHDQFLFIWRKDSCLTCYGYARVYLESLRKSSQQTFVIFFCTLTCDFVYVHDLIPFSYFLHSTSWGTIRRQRLIFIRCGHLSGKVRGRQISGWDDIWWAVWWISMHKQSCSGSDSPSACTRYSRDERG